VALLIATPVSLLNVICAPLISRLHAQGAHARLQTMISWVALAMNAMVLLLMLPFAIAGHQLLGRIFGPAFAASNTPLLILCIGVIGNACFGLNAQVLNMIGLEQRVTRAFAISLIALAVLTPPMVHFWQGSGAALASTLSVLLWNVLMWRDAWTRARLDTSVFSLWRSSRRADA
jgi:O-antigen/teichoic acid export membrane protein